MRKIICAIILLTLVFSQATAFAEVFVTPNGRRMIAASSTSRENPAELGDLVYIQDIQGNKGSVTEIVFAELFVGDEAKEIALAENNMNDEPDDDMQYVLARFEISFQSNDPNKYLMLFSDHFSVVTKQGNVIKSSIVNDNSKVVYGFHTQDQIYAGATTTIDVPLLIKKVDDILLIDYNNAWFQISDVPPFSDPNGIQFGWSEIGVIDHLGSTLGATDYKSINFEGGGHRTIFNDASLFGKGCCAYFDIKSLSQGVDTIWYAFPLDNDGEGATDIIGYLLELLTTSYGRCTYIDHKWESDNAKEEYAENLNKAFALGLYHEPMMWMLGDNILIYIDVITYSEEWKPFFSSESGKSIAVMFTHQKAN